MRIWRLAILLSVILMAVIFVANYYVVKNTRAQLFYNVKSVPKNKVGLLLGTAKYMDKARKIVNQYYQNRIDAAVALYMAGKVDYIIVSGDNSTQFYNEPLLMKNDLIERGVPESHIYMDNAGFRTLDSILRCRDIFGQSSFTIISQTFHNQRALFIANHKNLNTVAFCAADGNLYWSATIREKFARIKMLLDLILNKQAKFYGDKIDMP
ncbi:MAG: YdcF family protein [Taibaiella sp.]|nr:YdcF family protein [Taibaiella sp.]